MASDADDRTSDASPNDLAGADEKPDAPADTVFLPAAEPRFCILEVLVDDAGVAHDYRFVETNAAFDRHAGLNSAAGITTAAGMTAREVAPNLDPEWPATFLAVARSGRARRIYRPSELDGELLEIIAVPLGPPEALRVAITMAQVSEQRRSEDAVRRAYALLEGVAASTDDLIAAEDPDFRFIYFNEAYAKEFELLWGRRPKLGDSMVDLLAAWPAEQAKARALWARALAGEHYRIEEAFGPNAEETRTYDLRFNPFHDEDGHVVGAAHILRDITARVRAEQELRESARHKDEFLAMLGHELRNPLAAIQYATDVIARLMQVDGELVEAVSVLTRQSAHMARLVDGLLELSRVARGKITLKPEPLDLRPLLARVLADRSVEIDEQALIVEHVGVVEGPLPVRGDRARLTQVLDNVIANAIKYTPAGGRVKVAAGIEGKTVVVRVEDSGIGIAPDKLDLIFQAFHQEPEGAPRSRGGIGLGLALARRLSELHHGTLEAFSLGVGQGAAFTVRLPLREDGAEAVDPATLPPRAGPARTDLRLLIVEDNADAAQMLELMLRARGYVAVCATNGQDALTRLAGERFDAVLCDIGLPDIDGCELARRVRQDTSLSTVLMIALTGYGQAADRRRARAAGFDEYLVKPVTLEAVERALQSRQAAPNGPP